MRTNIDIDIDDALMERAIAATGLATKKATVEEALRRVVDIERRLTALDALRDSGWTGDLDQMRTDLDA